MKLYFVLNEYLSLKFFVENHREMFKFSRQLDLSQFEVDASDELEAQFWIDRTTSFEEKDFNSFKEDLCISCFGAVFSRKVPYGRDNSISNEYRPKYPFKVCTLCGENFCHELPAGVFNMVGRTPSGFMRPTMKIFILFRKSDGGKIKDENPATIQRNYINFYPAT